METTIQKTYVPNLRQVSRSLLVDLYFKAKETRENGIIRDYAAVDIVDRLKYDFSPFDADRKTQNQIAVRTEILDEITSEYISSTPLPVIVNLGAGLDTRHIRFGQAKWYQLDFEETINLRNLFFGDDSVNIPRNILDFYWINEIREKQDVLFIIEGTLQFLEPYKVKAIFREIAENFTNSLITFDTIPKSYINLTGHKSYNLNLSPFRWGNHSESEIEEWSAGLKAHNHYHFLSRHKEKWRSQCLEALFPNIYNGLKVAVIKVN
ncbi:MAG: class I SAM-dependent methyltransferase [Bacteroidota bacterium]|nr:class I SAM-dependent methyltransferase [Bacteroidota bacterium]